MIEEDVLGVGGVCGDITITRLGIIRVFGFLPLDGRPWNISFFVELRSLHPTFRHTMVAQISDNVIITTVCVVRVSRCTFHCWHSGWCTERPIILLTLLLYLHIVFLTCRNVVAADAVNIAELAYTEFACYAFVADEVMLGKAVLCHGDHRGGINSVIFCFVELQCKPNAKQACLFC